MAVKTGSGSVSDFDLSKVLYQINDVYTSVLCSVRIHRGKLDGERRLEGGDFYGLFTA